MGESAVVYPGCREHRTGGEEGEHTDSLSSLLDWLVTESIEHRSTKSPSPYFLALAAVFFFFLIHFLPTCSSKTHTVGDDTKPQNTYAYLYRAWSLRERSQALAEITPAPFSKWSSLEHSHAPCFEGHVWCCHTTAELSHCRQRRPYMVCKAENIYYVALYRKGLLSCALAHQGGRVSEFNYKVH